VQFGAISPVGRSSIVPGKVAFTRLNPMVGVIDGFRWAILGGIQNLLAGIHYLLVCLFTPGIVTSEDRATLQMSFKEVRAVSDTVVPG